MASQDGSAAGVWRDALRWLRKETSPWDGSKDLPLAVDAAASLPDITRRLDGEEASHKLAAIAVAIDEVLVDWQEQERAHPPDQKRSHAIAAAVLLRRPDQFPGDFTEMVRVRFNKTPKQLCDDAISARQDAICRYWQGLDVGRFKTAHDPEVMTTLASALATKDDALAKSTNHPVLNPHFESIKRTDVDKGFWWRESTKRYVRELAKPGPLTIFAGADGSSDVGEPLHRVIARLAHINLLSNEIRPNSPETASTAIAKSVADVFSDRSPSYIGSVMRGLTAQRGLPPETVERTIDQVTGDRTVPASELGKRRRQAFVGKAIAELASQVLSTGNDATVVSGHNDSDIREALETALDGRDVRLYELHPADGHSRRRQDTLSEVDLFTQRVSGKEPITWVALLTALLRKQRSLLVGTDVRSPGLVAALATSRSNAERYAILLPPSTGIWAQPTDLLPGDKPEANWIETRLLLYKSLAGRYLELGVVPILADFPSQVPQFLQEVRLCAQIEARGETYVDYSTRYDKWWKRHRPLFGFGPSRNRDPRRGDLQFRWREWLEDLRRELESIIQKDAELDEHLLIEAWIRDPDERELFLWATSDHLLLRTSSAPRASLRVAGGVLQSAFREGDTRDQIETRAPWKVSVALPLTLDADQYHGLTIGVLRILSDQADGQISMIRSKASTLKLDELIHDGLDELAALGEHLADGRQEPDAG